jgi:hypothetical protein
MSMHRSQGKVSTEVSGFKGRDAKNSEKITVSLHFFEKIIEIGAISAAPDNSAAKEELGLNSVGVRI